MATNTEEIVIKFRTEGGQEVEETFRKAADAGEQFHQKITKAGSALGDLRLKSEARVANNVGAIAQAMTSGANAGEILATSITKVTESFRGSLLFAGAATVGYALYQGITSAGDAIIQLDANIAKLRGASLVSGQFLGVDQLNQSLSTSTGIVDQLRSKISTLRITAASLSTPGILGTVSNPIGALSSAILHSFQKIAQEELVETQKAIVGELDQAAQKQSILNDATREGLTGDEKKVELLKAEADHLERAAKIAASEATAGITGISPAQSAETNRYNLATAQIEKRFNLEQRELDLAAKTVDIQNEFLAPADESLEILNQRIDATKNLLDNQHLLTDQEREQYHIQLGQLEAAKQRAQFGRQLQRDLSGLELGRVRGGIGSDRARIESAQTRAQAASVYGTNSPEFQSAEASLEDEQFRQFQEYEKNPAAFRQKRIDEQHERERFQYLRNTGQLPLDIAISPIQERQAGVISSIKDLIDVLKGLPQAVGVA